VDSRGSGERKKKGLRGTYAPKSVRRGENTSPRRDERANGIATNEEGAGKKRREQWEHEKKRRKRRACRQQIKMTVVSRAYKWGIGKKQYGAKTTKGGVQTSGARKVKRTKGESHHQGKGTKEKKIQGHASPATNETPRMHGKRGENKNKL